MIDARPQIATALQTVCNNVKMSRPAGEAEWPLIIYAQVGNTPINSLYVRLKWRISVYSTTRSELTSLCDGVDDVMHGQFGFTRIGMTGDDATRVETGLYMCRLDYSGLVNTQNLQVIKYSS